MNLIQKLQATPKWSEFEEWYEVWRESNKKNYHTFNIEVFKQYCLDIQKGVFEKFIESRGCRLEQEWNGEQMDYYLWSGHPVQSLVFYDSFEALLIWYFNN